MDTENRWVAVVPPDGSVMLALLKPWKGSEESLQDRVSDRRCAGNGGYRIEIPGMVGSWCPL